LDSFSFLPRYRGARHQAVESYVVNRRRTGKSGAAPLHPLERTAGSASVPVESLPGPDPRFRSHR